MTKYALLAAAIASASILTGCNTTRSSVPVVEAGARLTPGALRDVGARNVSRSTAGQYNPQQANSYPANEDVVINAQPINRGLIEEVPNAGASTQGYNQQWQDTQTQTNNQWQQTQTQVQTQIEQGRQQYQGSEQDYQNKLRAAQANYAQQPLPAPVQSLISSAEQSAQRGDFNGAAAQLERAQRIAPAEPIILHRLSEVYLAQGEPSSAEQIAQRGLSLSNNKPALQASFWELIARARDEQGNSAGAAQARSQAKVLL